MNCSHVTFYDYPPSTFCTLPHCSSYTPLNIPLPPAPLSLLFLLPYLRISDSAFLSPSFSFFLSILLIWNIIDIYRNFLFICSIYLSIHLIIYISKHPSPSNFLHSHPLNKVGGFEKFLINKSINLPSFFLSTFFRLPLAHPPFLFFFLPPPIYPQTDDIYKFRWPWHVFFWFSNNTHKSIKVYLSCC